METNSRDVVVLTRAGQIGMAIARMIGYGKKIIVVGKRSIHCASA